MSDYISREALKEIIHAHHYRLADALGSRDWGMFTIGIDQAIDELPAADVAPVVHGRWIIDKGLYRCSICNHLWSELWWAEIVPLEKMTEIMPYCPKCGAKMDGEDQNEIERC